MSVSLSDFSVHVENNSVAGDTIQAAISSEHHEKHCIVGLLAESSVPTVDGATTDWGNQSSQNDQVKTNNRSKLLKHFSLLNYKVIICMIWWIWGVFVLFLVAMTPEHDLRCDECKKEKQLITHMSCFHISEDASSLLTQTTFRMLFTCHGVQ